MTAKTTPEKLLKKAPIEGKKLPQTLYILNKLVGIDDSAFYSNNRNKTRVFMLNRVGCWWVTRYGKVVFFDGSIFYLLPWRLTRSVEQSKE